MSRPRKCRRVCELPRTLTFFPEDNQNREQAVVLTVDEYEAVRCDHHDHQHGGEAHACGDHGCGRHTCG